jgi:hypothetical integral membrane protein (TIGR02206 family)
MARFEAFSALHFATIGAFALFWLALVLAGRAFAGRAGQRAWRNGLASFVLACWVFANGVQLLPGHFRADVVLPLQVCDVAGLVAALALWRPGRHANAVLHFWGLGFSAQAILTPELLYGPGHIDFWTFWPPHANLVGAACYALAVDRYRPAWADARLAFGWALVYFGLVLPFDLVTGFNYGYLGPGRPLNPSLLDWLGPWPWRIASMAALTAAGFVLLALPWAWRRVSAGRV